MWVIYKVESDNMDGYELRGYKNVDKDGFDQFMSELSKDQLVCLNGHDYADAWPGPESADENIRFTQTVKSLKKPWLGGAHS